MQQWNTIDSELHNTIEIMQYISMQTKQTKIPTYTHITTDNIKRININKCLMTIRIYILCNKVTLVTNRILTTYKFLKNKYVSINNIRNNTKVLTKYLFIIKQIYTSKKGKWNA